MRLREFGSYIVVVYFVYRGDIVSVTIRVSRSTKEALLRVAARMQEHAGRRVDLDEAIARLAASEKIPGAFESFVGSVKSADASAVLEVLASERRLDEQRTSRKYGT